MKPLMITVLMFVSIHGHADEAYTARMAVELSILEQQAAQGEAQAPQNPYNPGYTKVNVPEPTERRCTSYWAKGWNGNVLVTNCND